MICLAQWSEVASSHLMVSLMPIITVTSRRVRVAPQVRRRVADLGPRVRDVQQAAERVDARLHNCREVSPEHAAFANVETERGGDVLGEPDEAGWSV